MERKEKIYHEKKKKKEKVVALEHHNCKGNPLFKLLFSAKIPTFFCLLTFLFALMPPHHWLQTMVDTAPLSYHSDPTKVWGSRLAKASSSLSLKIPHCSLAAERSPRGKHVTVHRAAGGISLDSGAVIFLREGKVLTLQIHPCTLEQYQGIVPSLG